MDRPDAPRVERRRLTHVDRRGRPRMVDVSAKPPTARRAVAEAEVAVSPETMSLVIDGGNEKGDVLTVAELAGVMARQAHRGPHPALPPAPADRPVRLDQPGSRRRCPPGPRRGRHDRSDRRGDGGADGRGRGRAHRVRHGQGRGTRRRDPCAAPALQDRRQERRLAPTRGRGRRARGRGGTPVTGWPAASASASLSDGIPAAPGARGPVRARRDGERPERVGCTSGHLRRARGECDWWRSASPWSGGSSRTTWTPSRRSSSPAPATTRWSSPRAAPA